MADYIYRIMDELDRTEELLYKGLKEINDKGDLNAQSLEVLGETLDGVKDLCEIKGKGIRMIEEYSGRYDRGRFSRGDWHDGRSYEGRSYTDGHSYADDPYLADLHRKMESAKSDTERDVIRNMIMDRERSR